MQTPICDISSVKKVKEMGLTQTDNNELPNENQEMKDGKLEIKWENVPYLILIEIFKCLNVRDLIHASETCQRWNSISKDEYLWKPVFHRDFRVDRNIGLAPEKDSWLNEYIRLTDCIPIVESEVLTDHSNEVLHVSYAHDGTMFSTCSKDGYVFVWNCADYPTKLKFEHDLKLFSWKYTQFSQFNASDTLLLVSGVHFGAHSTSGEIAVFNLQDFSLQCRIVNKPYDIFGAWYNDEYLISGELRWLAHLVSTSILWINKASQEPESEFTAVINRLFKFYNVNSSSIRAVTVANCSPPVETVNKTSKQTSKQTTNMKCNDADAYASPINYTSDYRQLECNDYIPANKHDDDVCKDDAEEDALENDQIEKYLIYTTGTDTYTPHLVGFKRIKPDPFQKVLDPGPSLKERIAERKRERELKDSGLGNPELDWADYESVRYKFDEPDHLVNLHGHIIGMGLSPNHRFLYVNCRPWPVGYEIDNPLDPPPIAQEIDIHVIDMGTLREVGTMFRSHKAYTPNDECFFIFLDVSHEYVASGAEDRHGYMWDRHYGICLCKLPHKSVVNAIAFNPKDSEMLVTVSDDYTVKVWRSRNKCRQLNIKYKELNSGSEFCRKS